LQSSTIHRFELRVLWDVFDEALCWTWLSALVGISTLIIVGIMRHKRIASMWWWLPHSLFTGG
jgi:hypothetical protein